MQCSGVECSAVQCSAVWVWVAYVSVYVNSSALREQIQQPWIASGSYACARVRLCMLACVSRLPIFDTLARTGSNPLVRNTPVSDAFGKT